jgi:leucyl aminopeptidase
MAKIESPFNVHLHAKDLSTLTGQAVVFFSKKSTQKDKPPHITEKDVSKVFELSLKDKVISGAPNEAVIFREANLNAFRHVLVLGLGEDSRTSAETLRQSGAALVKEARASKLEEVFVHLDGLSGGKKPQTKYIQAFVEGLHLAAYQFDELKTKKDPVKTLNIHLVSKQGKDKSIVSAFHEGTVLANCTNFVRRLGDMPANYMTPTILGQEAIAAAKGTGLKVTVWDKKRIEKENMGGLLGVAQGTDQEPRFIVMEYNGGAKSKKPVVFVGKGLTFDSGGISLKPGGKMEEMKYDMCGGAAVIGTLLAIAQLKLKVNAIAVVPATENMPNGNATKPGDVHTARNGKTFEINNTDAEGRLILADALCYASDQKPQAIVDAATLTGAMVVALGNIHTGYFTKNAALKSKIEKAAESSGELVWNMPLTEAHTKDMRGAFADLSNISYTGGAGSATGAAFLEQFVAEGIPWVHFDIAGTASACGNRLNYCSAKGATGVMVRTFVELAKSF